MSIVYLFLEKNSARIPFLGYKSNIFALFNKLGGIWDSNNQIFIFKQRLNHEQLKAAFNVICVIAPNLHEDNYQVQIHGFLEHPLENEENALILPLPNKLNINSNTNILEPSVDFPQEHTQAEKLSKYWQDKLEDELRARKYSPKTQKAYIYFNCLFLRKLQKLPSEICQDDITKFLALMEKERDYSASSINLAISAIKFFYKDVFKNNIVNEQKRPVHSKNLPVVLSSSEIIKILNTEKNPKHRLLLMLAYSSGLRVSEVVALKKEHIDLSRQVLFVRQGKGRKDRYTMLSEKAAQFIKEYYDSFKIEKWIFPGQPSSCHLSVRSAQHIFDKAVRNAGITKKVSIHGLRHSFATHLLENGTDIRYIQTLLGHTNIRTTERYTHVAKRSVLKIKSPLDSISDSPV